MKVRTRMLIAFMVLGLLGLTYLFYFIENKIKPVYLDPIEDDLVETATLLSSVLAVSSQDNLIDLTLFTAIMNNADRRVLNARIYDRIKTDLDLHIYVTDATGIVLYDSNGGLEVGQDMGQKNDINRTLKGEYGARSSWTGSDESRKLNFYVASPVLVADDLIGVVSVGKPSPSVAFTLLRKMRQEAFLGVFLGVFLAMALSVLFSIWVTRPIRRLTEYVDAIRDGKRARPPELGASDIGGLGQSFEAMRDAVEGKQYVEQYVQTLTHEIKSPLSAIKGASELLHEAMPEERRKGFLANILNESHRIQRIVDRLLELSAIENRKELRNVAEFSPVDVIEEALSSARPLLAAKNISLTFEKHEPSPITGERFLIYQAFSNLIQNAIDFTPIGGELRILIQNNELSIKDTGPGVPDYALDRVFERFYSLQRPDSGRKSSGLGLSIVRSIAELHQAEVSLTNAPEGGAKAVFRYQSPQPEQSI